MIEPELTTPTIKVNLRMLKNLQGESLAKVCSTLCAVLVCGYSGRQHFLSATEVYVQKVLSQDSRGKFAMKPYLSILDISVTISVP